MMKLKEIGHDDILQKILQDQSMQKQISASVDKSNKMKKAMGSLKLNYEPPAHLKNMSDDDLFRALKNKH